MSAIPAANRLKKMVVIGTLGLSMVVLSGVSQAYYNGAPAYNSNYRPVYAHMGVEKYVDLTSIHVLREDDAWLEFNVLIRSAKEDADALEAGSTTIGFRVNKRSREAWLKQDAGWKYMNLNTTSPRGYEISSISAVNLCYEYLHGEFLNDTSGMAAAAGKNYKGQ